MQVKQLQQVKSVYSTAKPYLPAAGFVGGWTWDSLTLKRIDNPLDLAIIGLYLILISVLVILINRGVKFKFDHLMPLAVQFLFGGILSPFTVYYFKSTANFYALLFTGLIVALLVVNEFFEAHYGGNRLTFIMLSVCYFLYFTFLVPVVVRHMNGWVFLLTIIIALAASYGMIRILGDNIDRLIPVGGIYTVSLLLYTANVIPPVPLATKQIGIYRSVEKIDNQYHCRLARPPWYAFNRSSETNFAYNEGDTVYCFTAIFAPTFLRKEVAHHWLWHNGNNWVTTNAITYSITGGRDAGYRGYTYKTVLSPGKWKVQLKTDEGKTLGSIRFDIVPGDHLMTNFKTVIN